MEEEKIKCTRRVRLGYHYYHFKYDEDRCPKCGAHRVCGKKHDNEAVEHLCERIFKEIMANR